MLNLVVEISTFSIKKDDIDGWQKKIMGQKDVTPFSLHLAEEQKSGIQKININKILFIIYYYIEFFRKN